MNQSEITLINVPLAQLVAAEVNPNSMPEHEYLALIEATRRFGFLQPVAVRPRPDGTFETLDGHHRIRAAVELGMTEVPCVVRANTNDTEAVLIRVGMNKIRGEQDLTKVGQEMARVVGTGIDVSELTVTGFTDSEVADLLRSVDIDVDAQAVTAERGPAEDFDTNDETVKPFLLEIEFTDRAEYQRARRGLKRAAGKGKDMAVGLMKLLGEDT